MEWLKVYDLREDREKIEAVQRATLETEEFGVKPEPALFGSPEWWEAIDKGRLPKHWVAGVIRRPIWTSMNDFPEVEIEEDSGKVSQWVRYGDVTQYSMGRGIKLCWVAQQPKRPELIPELIIDESGSWSTVVEVWLEVGSWRPTAASGPGPGRSLAEGWEGGRA